MPVATKKRHSKWQISTEDCGFCKCSETRDNILGLEWLDNNILELIVINPQVYEILNL